MNFFNSPLWQIISRNEMKYPTSRFNKYIFNEMSPHIIQWDVSFEAIQTYVKILYFNLTV